MVADDRGHTAVVAALLGAGAKTTDMLNKEKVGQLMEMGFEEDSALAALMVNNGDVEASMNSLLS